MPAPSVGLLPLYLKLYDDALPDARAGAEAFAGTVAAGLTACGLTVLPAPVCRVAAECEAAARRWLEQENLTAFSVNFLAATRESGLPVVPFLEASKAMARGIGYAGEGDVLTAALVGALASICPQTTFTEMFCPDWAGESIFLSHMDEGNPELLAGRPQLLQKPFPWTDAGAPVVAAGRLRGGDAACLLRGDDRVAGDGDRLTGRRREALWLRLPPSG